MNSSSRPPLALAVLIAFGVVLAQALLVPLFAAPAANLAPRDLPVVVAGPAPAADAMAGQLRQAEPGAFQVTTVPDAAAATTRMTDYSLRTAPGATPVRDFRRFLSRLAEVKGGALAEPLNTLRRRGVGAIT